jgi:ribosome-binding factor A
MPKEFGRHERIAGAVQRGLAQLLSSEVNDPRVAGLTVTEVRVSSDCRHANVFVTRMIKVSNQDIEDILDGIGGASGFLRSRLAKAMNLRRCPELHFEYDHNIQRASDLTALIDSVQPVESERELDKEQED